MSRKSHSRILTAIAAGGLVALALSQTAEAQDGNRIRVRGAIESLSGDQLVVKTREGSDATITLKAGWKVGGIKKALVEDIKPGDFVGVASLPKGTGPDGAIEVLIFPASMKGTGEGNRPWDAQPNSQMTNATVSNAVKSVNGHTITLTYQGKEKTITIADATPIVTLAPATKDDLKSGAGVIVTGEKAADGSITASQVAVGLDGIVPPM
ncbi:hypothetical protein RLEG12_30635 [Rhizobium leguminosarum bv. trifolii CB782]|uniref:DUF5666 domain-containing protein n=1 Tax=Rhizobium hidalgonense TaxID=1538159 RepID=A0A2A6KIL9_9HYPH|nr:DUF5666 domain-containing protein [Rhizobium hidalgonense]AHG47348.1 hypothetical protein RLEG12_30635 [Rhizobium leguminosarum bv. trifolii CB782]EJC76251.1 hypothetical protein Rleg10DRAFT_4899 [Rhizobium leguminosarum bv. trifolii WSM2012]MDR9773753.1 DUF5666 domain-containing protein [Rhizobium hidalgonense]MDR9810921.1 DUF5666 domain-containing protein [Rhizobium hidalgonense]MDR9819869.1 DUF5666 domain-containing protein [Rhizobium hidalgonense]